MTPLLRTLTAGAAAAALTVAAAGCSPSSGSSDHNASASGSSASQTKKVAVTVMGNDVTPSAKPMTISVGQPVELDVTADRAGQLHVHSSPEHEFSFQPGTSTFRFTLNQPGTVIVEEHESGDLVLKILVK